MAFTAYFTKYSAKVTELITGALFHKRKLNMELNVKPVEIESSGIIEEDQFGIADMGFILHILRKQMYSNSIAAICREITCNGRDAHREIGKNDVPIQISLPNALEPDWRCRDFGPGITPERMKNVFIKYAASTKRGDNIQTGGFGLGAKTPFGYSDQFVINTFTQEGDKRIKRTYVALIDESRRGKVSLMETCETDEPTGTEIVVPVESKDFDRFRSETHFCTRHWDTKPIIHGGKIEYDDFTPDKIVLEGTNWFLAKEPGGNRMTHLVIDGIEYPFDLNCLDNKIIRNFSYGTGLYLKFPVGVVSLSATREAVEIDDNTKNLVTLALTVVKNELQAKVDDAIKSCTTYLEANLALQKILSSLAIEYNSDIFWNGKKLVGRYFNFRYDELSIQKYFLSTSGKKETASKRGGNRTEHQIDLEELKDTLLCVNDIDNCTEAAVRSVLKANPDFKTVAIIKFVGVEADICKKHGLDNLEGIVRVSQFFTPRKANARQSLGRLIFYKFDMGSFGRTSLDAYENDPNKKVWVSLSRNQYEKTAYPVIKKHADSSNIIRNFIEKFPGYSVYGFMDDLDKTRLDEATSEMTNIEKFIEDYATSNTLDLGEIQYASNLNSYDLRPIVGVEVLRALVDKESEFTNKKSSLLSYAKNYTAFIQKVNELREWRWILRFGGQITSSNFRASFSTDDKAVLAEYPMLEYINNSYNRDDPASVKNIVEYVNTVETAKVMKAFSAMAAIKKP